MNVIKYIKTFCFLLTNMVILATGSPLYADTVTGVDTSETSTYMFDIVDLDVVTSNMNHSTNPRFAASFKVVPTGEPEDYLDASGNPIKFYVNQFVKYGDSTSDTNMNDTHSYWSEGISVQPKTGGEEGEWEFTARCSDRCAYDLEAGSVLNLGSYWGDYITITVRVGIEGWHSPGPSPIGSTFRVKKFRFRAPQCLNKVNTVDGNTRFEQVTKWDAAENSLLTEGGDFNFHDLWRLTCKQWPPWIPSNWFEETLIYQCNWSNNSGGTWCREGNIKVNFNTEYPAARMYDDSGLTSHSSGGWENWHSNLPFLKDSYASYWDSIGDGGVSLTGRNAYVFDVIGQNTFYWRYFSHNWYAFQTWVPDSSPAYITCFYATTDRPSETPILGQPASFGCQDRRGRYLPPTGVNLSATGEVNGVSKTVTYDSTKPKTYHTYRGYPLTIKSDVRMRPQQCIAYINDYAVTCKDSNSGTTYSGIKKEGGNHWEVQWHDEAHFKVNECTYELATSPLSVGTHQGLVHLKYKAGDEGGNILLECPYKVVVRELPQKTIQTNIVVTSTHPYSTHSGYVKEDWSANYYVSGGSKTLTFYADESGNTNQSYTYVWKFTNSGYSGDNTTKTGSSVSWAATQHGTITAKLYVRYHKGHVDIVNNKFKMIDDGTVEEYLDSRTLTVEMQEALANKAVQRCAFVVLPPISATRWAWHKSDDGTTYDVSDSSSYQHAFQCIKKINNSDVVDQTLSNAKAIEGKIMNMPADGEYITSNLDGTDPGNSDYRTGKYQIFEYKGYADVYYASYTENIVHNESGMLKDDNGNDVTDEKLDRWNGVKPNTVYYKWKVLCPDNSENLANFGVSITSGTTAWQKLNVPVELNKVNKLTKVSVSPIKLKFTKPYGTKANPHRYFKVFLEVKYTDVVFKPTFSGSVITDFTKIETDRLFTLPSPYVTNGQNTGFFRSYGSLTYPLVTSYGGAVTFGSLGLLTKINDGVPAKIDISGPLYGYTGDPLLRNYIEVTVKDNNPDATIRNIEVYYNAYDNNGEVIPTTPAKLLASSIPTTYVEENASNDSDFPATFDNFMSTPKGFNITNSHITNSQPNADGYDDGIIPSNVKIYTDNVASDTNKMELKYFYHLPDSFVSNDLFKEIKYHAVAYVDDGHTNVTSTPLNVGGTNIYTRRDNIHSVTSEEKTIKIRDNDRPFARVTLVNPITGRTSVYEIREALNDYIKDGADRSKIAAINEVYTTDAKCHVSCNDTSLDNPTVLNTYVGNESEYTFAHAFEIMAGQRFLCTTTLADNVMTNRFMTLNVDYKDVETGGKTYNQIELALDETENTLGSYTAVINDYLIFAKPEDENKIMDFIVTDASGNKRTFHIPIQILPEASANIRILERRNEKR